MHSDSHPLPHPVEAPLNDGFQPVWLRPDLQVELRGFPDAPIGIARESGTHRLIAVKPISAGTTLFRIEGEPADEPTRYSVQVGDGIHIDLRHGHSDAEIFENYFWRFLNHSCNPNVMIRDRNVIALRDIETAEDVTFDYNTTEFDMDEPFTCQCSSPDCLGTIQGFRHLTREQQERLVPFLPPWLSRHLEGESATIG